MFYGIWRRKPIYSPNGPQNAIKHQPKLSNCTGIVLIEDNLHHASSCYKYMLLNFIWQMVDTGHLPLDQFGKEVTNFLDKSNSLKEGWQRDKTDDSPECVYLHKKTVKSLNLNKLDTKLKPPEQGDTKTTDDQFEDLSIEMGLEGEDDQATLPQDQTNSELITLEYHIVYSTSYGVPVLYFNAHKQNGKLLSLDELWSTIPPHYQERLQHEKWTFVTQQEHPLLGRPYFQLHPCYTETFMGNRTAGNWEGGSYLVRWLSAVGPVVHLDLPMAFAS